jgi:hypothetical protein
MDLNIFLHKLFEIKSINIFYFNSLIWWIISICLNILILLPIRWYSEYIKLNIDYKKVFLLFSVYLILTFWFTLIDMQVNYWGFWDMVEFSQFSSIELYIIFITIMGLVPWIMSYKFLFYNRIKK